MSAIGAGGEAVVPRSLTVGEIYSAALTNQDFFPFATPRPSAFVIAGVLCIFYALAVPLLNYASVGTVLFSDLSLYYSAASVAFFVVGRLVKHSEKA